ncbi:MAG: hypothetical protein ACUVSZ_14740, partial [Chloroflexus sp.]|uniref:hypothetical protein n=1 Tax=Chloroflexus sp. TaxID=1904827 RepID=UPI00404AD293
HEIAECARADQRVGQTCMRSLPVDGYVARDSCLRTGGHGQHLPAEAGWGRVAGSPELSLHS